MACLSLNCFSLRQSKLTPKQQDFEYSLTRGFATIGTSAYFDGNLYNNMFKVNESILLTGVSFCGPAEVEKSLYLVFIEVLEMHKDQMKQFVVKDHWDVVEGRKGELFRCDFQMPVPLKKKVIYDIRFEIKGPQTEYCDDLGNCHKIGTYRDLVKFDFFTRSKQMPEIHFKLA